MKNSIKILALFIFLSILASSLTSCSNGDNTQAVNGNSQSNNNAQTANVSNANPVEKSKRSDYPDIAQEIMQADLKALDGSTFKLEDYKGKVVLVNFWATWCKPCIKEMPELVELREANKDKGFEVIGVNSDPEEDMEMIIKFSEKMNLTYKVAQSEESFFEGFLKISRFNGIPQSFLIDREGKLTGVFVGGSDATLTKMKDNVAKLMAES